RALCGLFLGDDVVAESHAFVADEDAWARNELAHLASPLSAERTVEIIHRGSSITSGLGSRQAHRLKCFGSCWAYPKQPLIFFEFFLCCFVSGCRPANVSRK